MDRYSYLIYPPYLFLLVGIVFLVLAVIWTFTGKAFTRFNRRVYLAEEPIVYWWNVASYYFVGVFLIGYFLYKV
jgi:hypothetical protein